MSGKTGRSSEDGGGDSGGGSESVAAGKRSRSEGLPPMRGSVQLKGGAGAAGVQSAAASGIASGGESLPFMDVIQQSFGGFDVSDVQAHVGGAATDACADMGAQAFATGNHVAFGGAPDLHTAAHEAAHVVQQRAGVQLQDGVGQSGDAYERHADAVADRVVGGESADGLLGEMAGGDGGGLAAASGGGGVQRKTVVNPIAASLHNRVALLGDGTPANQGLKVSELASYVARQADWFSEPSVTAADRDNVWKVLLLCEEGAHVPVALGSLRTAEVAALGAGDLLTLKKYAACFDSAAETVQLHTPAPTIARALKLGQAIIDLELFVPTPVLRIVIPEAGLVYLVDKGKIPELKKYYKDCSPTLEAPAEWPHIQDLLDETIAANAALKGWVHDLHIITKASRVKLRANVADRSRSKPVLLILMSASDWNTAFLQASNLQDAILNGKNNALLVQGPTSIANATSEVTRVADDYGQQSTYFDWNTWSIAKTPGRLGQVVIAGHGSDQSVEMASPGTGAHSANDKRNVGYDENSIDSSDPKKNGTELLMETVLSRMDPKDINVVFAGCLVGSHSIPPGTDVSNAATAQANLQAAIAAHPNLSDYVRDMMKAKGMTGTVQAANGSTTFDSFKVNGAGRAELSNTDDPDIGGTKLQYVRTGIEPEGALRAALECYADPAIGPAKTTAEIRTRVAGLAGNTGWWETITRVGFELCLPAAGDVDVSKLLDISHRIAMWFFGGWEEMIDVQAMANNVTTAEAPTVFPAMLTSSWATADHLQVGVPEAWMKHDASKTAAFMTALTASSLTRETFQSLLARAIVDPKLSTLLPIGAPTKGQMILALTIAVHDGAAMPAAVKTFLRDAAGGKATATFPAGLGAGPIIAPTGELSVLENIGLAPTSAPTPGSGSSTTVVDGNVDANHNGKNETFIAVSPHEATVNTAVLNVRKMASTSSTVVDTVTLGTVVRVMGKTETDWSFIDNAGKTGFVYSKYLA